MYTEHANMFGTQWQQQLTTKKQITEYYVITIDSAMRWMLTDEKDSKTEITPGEVLHCEDT